VYLYIFVCVIVIFEMNFGGGILRPLVGENVPSAANSTQRYARVLVRNLRANYRIRAAAYTSRHASDRVTISNFRAQVLNLSNQVLNLSNQVTAMGTQLQNATQQIGQITIQLDRERMGQIESAIDDIIRNIENNEQDLAIQHTEMDEN